MKKSFLFTTAVLLLIIISSILYANFFTGFLDSARAGNTARVQKLLSDNKDKATRIMALNYAIYNNRTDTVALLLNYVKPSNYRALGRLESPILIASRKGNNAIVKNLIDKGASLDNALSVAISNGNYETAEILLNNGANPNITVDYNLDLNPKYNHKISDLIQLMIDKGADAKSDFGSTAIITAVELKNHELVNTLIKSGASVHLSKALDSAVNEGDKEMITFLIEKGAVIEERVLSSALQSNRTDLFKYLLNRVAPSEIYNYSDNLVTSAIAHNNSEAIKLLLEKGIDLNNVRKGYNYPLIHAAATLNSEMVKLLLENGASANVIDLAQRTPVDIVNSTREHLDWFDLGHKEDCRRILDLLKEYNKQ